jgi:hypothetical protein
MSEVENGTYTVTVVKKDGEETPIATKIDKDGQSYWSLEEEPKETNLDELVGGTRKKRRRKSRKSKSLRKKRRSHRKTKTVL